MKTTVERESPTKVRLLVEVEPSEIDKLTSDTVRKLSQEFKVPGFRKGKVPRQILESRMGKDAIRQRMLEESLPRLYTDAAKEESLRPVTTPDIEVTDFGGDTLSFTATVEVRPEIHLPNYRELEIERPSTKASREEIDDRLDVLRKRFATLDPVARNAEAGDHLLIDVKTTIHDQKIDEASANDFLYELGSATLAPELDEELKGKRAGDIIKFNTTLPERLSKDHGGEEVTMTVIVKEVNAKRLPEVDDEFAKTASEFDTIEELEGEIRDRIEEYKGVQADREIPDYLDVLKLSEDELRAAQRRAAERSIGADFLLDEIAKAEGMNVTRAELDEEVEHLSKRAGKTPDELRRDIVQAGRVEALAGDILRRKVLDYLVEQANITDEANTEG